MDRARYRRLERDPEASLSPHELAAGWHWCPDWDDMLVGPGMDEELSCCLCRYPAVMAAKAGGRGTGEDRMPADREPPPQEEPWDPAVHGTGPLTGDY